MKTRSDPSEPIREMAAAFPAVDKGTSCNQSSFKTGKRSFLYIGPGPKGKGFKAMFKLEASMPDATRMAAEEPDRFEVGSTGWVTARFTSEKPLPRRLWAEWLQESYNLSRSVAARK